ncbi:MAG: HAMP domain-containing sensor histidine kinase [Haloarculaceae archaeon]
MAVLSEDILTLARQSETLGDPEPSNLGAFGREVWYSVDSGGADLTIRSERSIRADPGRLRQLLENPLENAVEHGGDDVTVTIGALEDGERFYVADDGPGIPVSERVAVFEGGYTTRSNGRRFGLTSVEEIASAHGWVVDPVAAAEGGATVEHSGISIGHYPGRPMLVSTGSTRLRASGREERTCQWPAFFRCWSAVGP